jgi:hypothetical protein
VEAAHIFPSFLARDIRDGRLGVQVNRYTARLLVRDANHILARFGPTASIYLHSQRQDYVDTMQGRSHRYLKACCHSFEP